MPAVACECCARLMWNLYTWGCIDRCKSTPGSGTMAQTWSPYVCSQYTLWGRHPSIAMSRSWSRRFTPLPHLLSSPLTARRSITHTRQTCWLGVIMFRGAKGEFCEGWLYFWPEIIFTLLFKSVDFFVRLFVCYILLETHFDISSLLLWW